jgi:hypothetical protein
MMESHGTVGVNEGWHLSTSKKFKASKEDRAAMLMVEAIKKCAKENNIDAIDLWKSINKYSHLILL